MGGPRCRGSNRPGYVVGGVDTRERLSGLGEWCTIRRGGGGSVLTVCTRGGAHEIWGRRCLLAPSVTWARDGWPAGSR